MEESSHQEDTTNISSIGDDPLLREARSNSAAGRIEESASGIGGNTSYLRSMRNWQLQNRENKISAYRRNSLGGGAGGSSSFRRFLQRTGSGSTAGSGLIPNRKFATERTPLSSTREQRQHQYHTSSGANGAGELDDTTTIEEEEEEEDVEVTTAEALYDIVCGKGIISCCLLAIPFSLWAVYRGWSDTWIFWLNFTVMIPLAAILGDFTEEVALHTNEVTGGLINASFGNAVEVVVAIQALLANEIRVVQASMLGSIFSNLLLVLGCCFFFGGLRHKEQSFNSTSASANMGLLALSSIALVLPTPFAEYYDLHDEHVLIVSRIAAIFLIFMYAQLLVFQLYTHAHIFDDADDKGEQELATMSLAVSCMGLLAVTLAVCVFSHYLVNSIEGFTESSGVSRTFVGLIILPIVGNAVEHISAVVVAMKDKMDLAMGIAVGSCTQISLFVVPLTVLCGWIFDRDMTLNFPNFEIVLFVLSVFTVSVVCGNPKCNWLEGSLLITTYSLIAVGFWFENVRDF